MLIVIFGFFTSCVACYLLVRFNGLHGHLSNDHSDAGPQKFHAQPTPRIGGVAVALGLIAAYIYIRVTNQDISVTTQFSYLILASVPAFFGGLVEDLTKRVSVAKRLFLSVVSAGVGAWLLGAVVNHLGIPYIDWLLQWQIFSIVLTLFAVGGVVNAINIIDGFNGIVSGFAGFMLAAIALVSLLLQDFFLLSVSLAMSGALLGFLVWNYPHGKIFLGDGGSYLIGFWLAELVVLIVVRHPEVSPWFAALLLIHPVCETLFSIYRRKFLHGKSPWHPDGLHLHTLIFRRLNHIQWASNDPRHKVRCNSMTAPYFWSLKAFTALLAVVFWDNSLALIVATMLFVVFYVWLYWRIVKFKTPRWMVKHDRREYGYVAGEAAVGGRRDRRLAPVSLQFRFIPGFIRQNRRFDLTGKHKSFRLVGTPKGHCESQKLHEPK